MLYDAGHEGNRHEQPNGVNSDVRRPLIRQYRLTSRKVG